MQHLEYIVVSMANWNCVASFGTWNFLIDACVQYTIGKILEILE